MSSVLQKTCPSAVLQWKDKAQYWSRQTKVPTALILAIIDQESGGNSKASRHEAAYHARLMQQTAGRNKLVLISAATGVKTEDIVASYGLMQPLFSLAYGYGARSIEDLYDPDKNIRYCSAHLATLFNWLEVHTAWTDAQVKVVAGQYNGAGPNSKYARDVVTLYHKYDAYLKKEA